MINQNNFDFKSFEKPWHGQIFAITVSLSENKVFEWSESVSYTHLRAHET